MIIGVTFGSSIIVEDFEKYTGNLLFPKIERGRLLVGRYCAHYFYASISLCVFYFEIMIITLLNYDYIPEIIWESLGWALLYLHLVLSFCVLISALMKRVSEATILSLFFFLLIFTSLTSLLKYTESTIEPLFIPDYYANIITACFDMPRVRFTEMQLGRHGDHRIVLAWATPSVEGALIGMILYSSLLLFFAYMLYRRKQMHN
jgi:ABC-type transport system involved in multi-copper enzyme maturation permease subunit